MLPATHILGIDIAKDKFDVNLRRADTVDDRLQATFSNNPQGFKSLHKWLQQHGPRFCSHLHACMEATSCYGDALAAFLYDEDYQVSLVNPRRTRQYGDSQLTRNRNDKIEAGLIADFCATQRETLRLWEPLSPAHRQLRDLTRARQALVDDRERFANMLETATGMARSVFVKQVRQLKRQIKDLERAIKQYVALQTELKQPVELADSIVGVGLVTAATVIAELPPMEKISQAAQAVALMGLDPIKKTSGSSVNTAARLSRMGSRRGRKALYMPALVALRCNPIVRELGLRLQQKGRSGKYIIVAAMRKLLRLIFGVVKRGRPFDPEYTSNSHNALRAQSALATV